MGCFWPKHRGLAFPTWPGWDLLQRCPEGHAWLAVAPGGKGPWPTCYLPTRLPTALCSSCWLSQRDEGSRPCGRNQRGWRRHRPPALASPQDTCGGPTLRGGQAGSPCFSPPGHPVPHPIQHWVQDPRSSHSRAPWAPRTHVQMLGGPPEPRPQLDGMGSCTWGCGHQHLPQGGRSNCDRQPGKCSSLPMGTRVTKDPKARQLPDLTLSCV